MEKSYVNYIGVDVKYKDDGDIAYSSSPPPKYDYKCFQAPEYLPERNEYVIETLCGYKRYINKNEIVSISWKGEYVDDIKDSEIWKSKESES